MPTARGFDGPALPAAKDDRLAGVVERASQASVFVPPPSTPRT